MIYITGDIHGDFYVFDENRMLDDLTEDDTLIVCGDFGFTWDKRHVDNWMSFNHRYDVCFVRGNHDNVDILNSLPIIDRYGDKVGDFGNNTYWLLDGHMYQIEGRKLFCFGGAASIDKGWRMYEENLCNAPRTLWWPEEVPSNETFELASETLKEHNWKFDYFITHTCNPDVKCCVLESYKSGFFDPTETMISGLEYDIEHNGGEYKAHYFGHFHCNSDYRKEHCIYDTVLVAEGQEVKDEETH